jgi:hypothetical protein
MHGGRSARQRTTLAVAQEAVAQTKVMGVVTLHQPDRRTSQPTMSADVAARWGHRARECRSKPKKELAHVMQDVAEGSLLLRMATLTRPKAS